MSWLKKLFLFYFPKKKEVEQDEQESEFKVLERIDLKPYDSLKFDLIYAHDEILVDNDDIVIACRKYKNNLIKIALVHNFDNLSKYDLSNDSLREYVTNKGFLEEMNIDDLDTKAQACVYIFKEKTEDIKRYCFLNAKADSNNYIQYFIYNHDTCQLLRFRNLQEFNTPLEAYNTALYFDLACVDKEMY